jgi:hypothetical protein
MGSSIAVPGVDSAGGAQSMHREVKQSRRRAL